MKKTATAMAILVVTLGMAGCVPSATAAPEPAAATEEPSAGTTPASSSVARVRIYADLEEVAEDSTLIVIGTAADEQRLQDDYPGALTLTGITVTEVLKGDIDVGTTVTLGDFGAPTDAENQVQIDGGSGPVSPGKTYLLHLRPLGEYGTGPEGTLVDGNWILVSPFPSHYELQGDRFVLMAEEIDDTIPHSIPRDEAARLALAPE